MNQPTKNAPIAAATANTIGVAIWPDRLLAARCNGGPNRFSHPKSNALPIIQSAVFTPTIHSAKISTITNASTTFPGLNMPPWSVTNV
ncbi:hypothetical protein OIE68_20065 [Nocardia vinacea]|uniref:hypothetical protein n=1 Tax=Nocardia vinacea TaxID=96468 RepID=UPI002E0EE104|nr:hypothetical protein OIE68_20065 [Nocardia vinacea]